MKTTLPVLTLPNPQLRELSLPISAAEISTPEFQRLCDDMIKTMYEDDGIGLAAPQVGRKIRLVVVGKDAFAGIADLPFPQGHDAAFINPEFENYSWKTVVDEEGCLSVPGLVGDVERHAQISVKAQLRDGGSVSFVARDFFARVLQHELDHLNGVLFIDRTRKTHKKKLDL